MFDEIKEIIKTLTMLMLGSVTNQFCAAFALRLEYTFVYYFFTVVAYCFAFAVFAYVFHLLCKGIIGENAKGGKR